MNKTETHIIRKVHSVERKKDSKGKVQLEKHELIEVLPFLLTLSLAVLPC